MGEIIVPNLICSCGWKGQPHELRKAGCLTLGDEWFECPSCGQEAAKMTQPCRCAGLRIDGMYFPVEMIQQPIDVITANIKEGVLRLADQEQQAAWDAFVNGARPKSFHFAFICTTCGLDFSLYPVDGPGAHIEWGMSEPCGEATRFEQPPVNQNMMIDELIAGSQPYNPNLAKIKVVHGFLEEDGSITMVGESGKA